MYCIIFPYSDPVIKLLPKVVEDKTSPVKISTSTSKRKGSAKEAARKAQLSLELKRKFKRQLRERKEK